MDKGKSDGESILERTLRDFDPYLTEDQREQARACNSMLELSLFAAREHLELPGETLKAISGAPLIRPRKVSSSNPGLDRLLALWRDEEYKDLEGGIHVLPAD